MKRLSFWYLIVTLTLQVQAGVPEPKGLWEFNGTNPNSATIGAPLGLFGSAQDAAGITPEDGAIMIGEDSYYICTHGIAPNGGGAKVNEWTLLIDFSYPPSSRSDPPNGYNDLFQTDPTNADDADWTIRAEGAIGIGAVGYSVAYGYTTEPDTWYRMVLVVDNGVRHDLYVDGVEIFKGNQQGIDGRFSLADTILLFAAGYNQDGDDAPINVSTVAIWDIPLNSDEILSLGYAGQKSYGDSPQATNPDPADGALHTDTWVSMAWRAGDFAVSHDVYMGDNFDDVNDGIGDTFRGNVNDNYYIAGFAGQAFPDGLVPGTTYYWRIDEVNEAEPNCPWKGEVWSFSISPKTAYFPNPADDAELVDLDVRLSWTPGFGARLHYVIFGDDFDDVNNAVASNTQATTSYTPGELQLAKTYYWRVDEFDAAATHKGEVWSFTTEGAASGPNPANGAVDVSPTQVLTWNAGAVAASYEVYFGMDADAVKNATKSSPEYKVPKALGEESYDPGKLDFDSAYYWRVDEVNDASTDSPWAGKVWSFTTGNYFVIDDFEDYDTGDNQIWYAWHDGLGYGVAGTDPYFAGNGTGAAVGDETTASYAEETIVHGGGKSIPVSYDNNKQGYAYYSEVEHTLTDQRDWTERGVDSLSIWFRGGSYNEAEPLYVAVSNSTGTPAVVVYVNPAAAQIKKWTQWIIPLQTFADQGIDLTNVDNIAIGLGTQGNTIVPGGSGKMYFDDIRLYRPRLEMLP